MKKMLVILFIPAIAQADVLGIWQTEVNEEGKALQVEIKPCQSDAARYWGQIVKLINSDDGEIIGRSMIKSMQSDDGLSFSGGTIWAPDKDKTYQSKMRLDGNTLKVSGCALGGIVCRSQNWTRVP